MLQQGIKPGDATRRAILAERPNETGIPGCYTMRGLYDEVMACYHFGAQKWDPLCGRYSPTECRRAT